MDFSLTLGDILTVGALMVGIIGILWQIHEHNRQSKLTIFTIYTQRYQNIVINFPIEIEQDDFILDDHIANDRMLLVWIRAYFDLCSEEFQLHKDKLIDQHIWGLWDAGIQNSFQKPAFKDAWKKIQKNNYYNAIFANYIERLINK